MTPDEGQEKTTVEVLGSQGNDEGRQPRRRDEKDIDKPKDCPDEGGQDKNPNHVSLIFHPDEKLGRRVKGDRRYRGEGDIDPPDMRTM